VNNSPDAVDDSYTINEDAAVQTFTVLSNDSDPDL
jgi:hypothetical protein